MLIANCPDLFYFLQVITASPTPVGRILQANQGGPCLVHVVRINGRLHLFRIYPSAVTGKGTHLRSGIKGDASTLINIHVGLSFADHFITRLGMTLYADLIAHGTAGAV